jgi:hypothetical protein
MDAENQDQGSLFAGEISWFAKQVKRAAQHGFA